MMKNITAARAIISVIILVVMCASCAREVTENEKIKKANIEQEIQEAPAGSFLKMSDGKIFVIRDNFKKGGVIYFLQWRGEEIRLTAASLANNWPIQAVIVPDNPIWSKVARTYLPHRGIKEN